MCVRRWMQVTKLTQKAILSGKGQAGSLRSDCLSTKIDLSGKGTYQDLTANRGGGKRCRGHALKLLLTSLFSITMQ